MVYAIKCEIDLKCLNQGKDKCDLADSRGQKYILDEYGIYKSKDKWKKFKLGIKNSRR